MKWARLLCRLKSSYRMRYLTPPPSCCLHRSESKPGVSSDCSTWLRSEFLVPATVLNCQPRQYSSCRSSVDDPDEHNTATDRPVGEHDEHRHGKSFHAYQYQGSSMGIGATKDFLVRSLATIALRMPSVSAPASRSAIRGASHDILKKEQRLGCHLTCNTQADHHWPCYQLIETAKAMSHAPLRTKCGP